MSIKSVLTIVISLAFMYAFFTIGLPFLVALLFALALEPLVVFLMKHGRMKRGMASTIACTLLLGFLGLLFYLIILKAYSESLIFYQNQLPNYVDQVSDYVSDTVDRTQVFYENLSPDAAQKLKTAMETGLDTLTSTLKNIVGNLSNSLINVAKLVPQMLVFTAMFIASLYLFSYKLVDLNKSFLGLFHEDSRGQVQEVLTQLKKSIFGFFKAQIIISFLTYIVVVIGLFALRVNYAMSIGFLIVAVDALPVLGTSAIIIPWAIFSFVMHDTFLGVGLLVLFLVIAVFRRIIEPKILGNSVGIGALSALISIYIGLKLIGPMGLIMGPIVVIFFQTMRKVGLLPIKLKLH